MIPSTNFKIMYFFVALLIFIMQLNEIQTLKNYNFQSLNERVEKLTALSYRNPVIRLNSVNFRSYIGSKSVGQPERNYTFVVMLTALTAKHQCSVCHAADKEFSILAKSWRYSPNFTPDLFFGLVDYDQGSDIFQQLGIDSAPVFLLFGKRSKRTPAFSMKHIHKIDVQKIGFDAETISRWIHDKTSVSIDVIRPVNLTVPILMFILFGFVSVWIYLFRDNLIFLYSPKLYGFFALFIVLIMTSGQMWNHIRGAPLMQRSQNGMSYISPNSNSQFVVETYIVFTLNAAIAIGFIMMIDSGKSKGRMVSWANKKYTSGAGIALVTTFFFFLVSIFGYKAGYYPYTPSKII